MRRKMLAGLYVAGFLLAAAIFVIDVLVLPLGVAAAVPYVAVVLVCLWLPRRQYVLYGAIAVSALTLLGYFWSDPAGVPWLVLANRLLALFAIWVTAIVGYQCNRTAETSCMQDRPLATTSKRNDLQRDVLHIAEDEQRRIGHDLHDSIQQELVGLGMLAQTLLENLSKEPDHPDYPQAPRLRELATTIVNGLERASQNVRTISRGLVPYNLDIQGLHDALREFASRTDDLEGITCEFECKQSVEVADHLTVTHLYRIVQEATTNALKHGHPQHILISLESDDGQIILQIADDGVGFNPLHEKEGMGLKTMLYRASLIGASITVKSIEAGGTRVTCRVRRV